MMDAGTPICLDESYSAKYKKENLMLYDLTAGRENGLLPAFLDLLLLCLWKQKEFSISKIADTYGKVKKIKKSFGQLDQLHMREGEYLLSF